MSNDLQNNNLWIDQKYRTIYIVDGADATNSSLISWLEANATQQVASDPWITNVQQLESDLENVARAIRGTTKGLDQLVFPSDFLIELDQLPRRYPISVKPGGGSFAGNDTIVEGGVAKIKILPPSGKTHVSLTITGASYSTTKYGSGYIITLKNPQKYVFVSVGWTSS